MIRRLLLAVLSPANVRHVDLLHRLVRRELAVKYRGSFLGYLWSMANPLLFMATISLVFSYVVRDVPHYHLYVLSGILFWNFTSNSIMGGTHAIVNGATLLRKVRVPAWIFPSVPALTYLTNFALALVPYALLFIFTGPAQLPMIWQLPFVIFLFFIFVFGCSLFLSSINVFFRDVGHVIEPIMVMVMYGTPIIYDRRRPDFPPQIRDLLGFNPLTHFIEAGRACIFWHQQITLQQWLTLTGIAVGTLTLGTFAYRRLNHRFIFAL